MAIFWYRKINGKIMSHLTTKENKKSKTQPTKSNVYGIITQGLIFNDISWMKRCAYNSATWMIGQEECPLFTTKFRLVFRANGKEKLASYRVQYWKLWRLVRKTLLETDEKSAVQSSAWTLFTMLFYLQRPQRYLEETFIQAIAISVIKFEWQGLENNWVFL